MVQTPTLTTPSAPGEPPSKPPLHSRVGIVLVTCFALVFILYASKLFALFSAVPILYLTLSQGSLLGGLLLTFSTVALAWINPLDACFLMICTGFSCWIAGVFLRRGRKIDGAIFAGVLATVLLIGTIYGGLRITGALQKSQTLVNMRQDLLQNVDLFFQEIKQAEQQQNEPPVPVVAEELEAKRQSFRSWALAILPGGMVSLTAISLWIFLIFMRKSAEKMGFQEAYSHITQWKSPDLLIWPVIIVLSALIFKVEAAKILCVNVLIVLATVYLFQGIAIFVHTLNRMALPPLGRMLCFVTAIIFSQYLALVLVGLGFFDVWFDFRKLKVGAL